MHTNSTSGLPVGFISFDDAIKLINSDTRDNPKVDVAKLIKNLPFLRAKSAFTIFLLKRDANGQIVPNGNKPVQIASEYEKTIIEKTIIDKYKELTHRDYDKDGSGIRKITSTVTDSSDNRDANVNGIPSASLNQDSKVKVGDII